MGCNFSVHMKGTTIGGWRGTRRARRQDFINMREETERVAIHPIVPSIIRMRDKQTRQAFAEYIEGAGAMPATIRAVTSTVSEKSLARGK